MTLKLLGAILTLVVPAVAGFQIAARYGRRPGELRALQTGLSILITEVEYGAVPMPEALRSAGRAAGPPVGAIFAAAADRLQAGGGLTAGEALEAALRADSAATCLTPADRDVLAALVPVLGASGRQDQVRHLRLAQERLAGAEARATAERERYEKMYRYVGVLSGLALLLILI